MSVKHLYLIAVATLLGCAPASSTSGTAGMSVVGRNPKLLTSEEIAGANADVGTAYDALSRLRPNWLSAHGVSSFNSKGADYATVFLDGHEYGDLSSLKNIPANQVADIRYYDVTESGAKFGLLGGTNGVIEVTTRIR